MSRQDRMAAAAAAAAKHRQEQRRRAMLIGAAVVVVVVIIIVIARSAGGGNSKKTAVSGSSTTAPAASTAPTSIAPTSIAPSGTTAAASGSAAGKPCLAVSGALPKGAPAVPVKVGPPPTQLVIEDIKAGTGAPVAPGATVTVNYVGVACSTGKVFDSSYTAGGPATFSLAQVIKGWQDGIPGMKVGGERLLGIPAAQAYGAQGSAPAIGPDEALWFVIDLLSTKAA